MQAIDTLICQIPSIPEGGVGHDIDKHIVLCINNHFQLAMWL